MTIREFKTIGRLLKEVYGELSKEAMAAGIDLLSPEYKELVDKARLAVLGKHGFTLEEYREVKDHITGMTPEGSLEMVLDARKQLEDSVDKIRELDERHIPSSYEIQALAEEVAERVAKKYIVEPKIINKIVKVVKEPKIIKETIKQTVREEYNDKPLKKELKDINKKVDDVKTATLEEVNQFFKDNFSENFKKNINVLGMPDFRKLAMGLQQQIDEISIGVVSGTWGSIVGTLSDQADLQSALNAKATTSQTFYIGTTQVAINRASAALTLAGLTLTTPEIGVATGTSLDLGTTTKLESRLLTVDTGGVFNIALASAAGDDFTVDTDKLVVEGDTGNVGIGINTPDSKLHVAGAIKSGTTGTAGSLILGRSSDGANQVSLSSTGTNSLELYQSGGTETSKIKMDGTGFHFQTEESNVLTDRLNIIANGNVGIGTTNPTGKMHFKAGSTSYGAGGIRFEQSADTTYWDIMPAWGALFLGHNGSTMYQFTDNYLGTDGSNTGVSSISRSTYYNTWFANGGGNVGIGTTSPGYKLEITGQGYASSGFVVANNQGFGAKRAGGTVQDMILLDTGDDIQIGSSALANDINLRSNSGNLVTVLTTGNVGIGGTPYFKLDVAGNIRIQGTSLLYFGGSASASDWNTRIGLSGTDFAFSSARFIWTNGGYADSVSTWMNLASSGTAAYIGNLGLGTLTPTYKLDVKGNGYVVYATTFTGTGLNNVYGSGTYTGTDATAPTYTVVVDATGTPDTFKWKKNDGAFTTGVAMTAAAVALSDGVSVRFGTTTGHTLNDQWVITVQLSDPLGVQSVAGTRLMAVNNQGNVFIGTTDFDGTPAIGRLVVKGSTNDGSTNILVGRDSDEANVFSVNTNGQILSDSLTASEILITDASKNIVSAAVATYPSLTELAYLKGVTSGIQGQFSDKAATSQTFYIGTTQVAINRASAALTLAGITLTTPDIGTPSAGTLTNCSGLPLTGLVDDTTTALGVGSLELGHASDTTLTRVSAGVVAIEGNNIITSATVPVKATGAEINTGTDDAKFATAKAIEDSYLSALSTLNKGLVLGLPLDFATFKHISDAGGILDVAPAQNHGQNVGATFSATDGPDGNGAFDFDGADDYITIPHNVNQLLVNGFTISLWIKPDSAGEGNNGFIIGKNAGTTAQNGFMLRTRVGNVLGFIINSGTDILNNVDDIVYADGNWYHVVVTVSSAALVSYYVSGVSSGTPGTTGALSGITTTNALTIGNRSGATDRTFDGKIAKVRIYSRVLTANEIAALYKFKL